MKALRRGAQLKSVVTAAVAVAVVDEGGPVSWSEGRYVAEGEAMAAVQAPPRSGRQATKMTMRQWDAAVALRKMLLSR